jgi:hypothetical protein
MVIDMNDEQLHTLAQMRAFLDGTVALEFAVAVEERYGFIARTVRRFGYARLKRAEKSVVLRFLERVSGYSRQQLTRLVKRGCERGQLSKRYRGSRTSFARTYTSADVLLLAHIDNLHGTLSGLATKKLMERAFELFREVRYERLAGISVAHLYNLRQREGYQRQRQVWSKTRPVSIAIGERRAPAPNNQPGYLRVDSVHQGDQDGVKGVYHINTVDCVTQYEGVATCERISEAFLIPVLEALLQSFPFAIPSASTATTARNSSTTRSPSCSTSCSSKSKPNHARGTVTTTRKPNPRTGLSCANTSATALSRNASPVWSMRSAAITLTPTSISTAPACSPKSSPTPRAASASAIPTN